MMRGWLERIGRAFIALGAVVLLFAGYQVWGTDWVNAREQRSLKNEVRERLAEREQNRPLPTDLPTDADAEADAEPAPSLMARPDLGVPVGLIEIPSIGVEQAMVEGVGRDELQQGPGHYPHSPLPGRSGNVSIAGHRTTYGAPFSDLDALEQGDEIHVTTEDGAFTYVVSEQLIVEPSDVSVVEHTEEPRLTLTTCNPKYSARERLIVVAQLQGDPIDQPSEEEAPSKEVEPAAEAPPSAPPVLDADPAAITSLDGHSDSGLSAIDRGTILWTLTLAAVSMGWWWLVRKRPRWYSRLGGVLPFLLVLFFFFGELESLLPANF